MAQSDRGAITGTISDAGGASIPSAIVEARSRETGARYETASTKTGNYTLAQLPAGVYQVSVSMPGFKQYVREGVAVPVAQTLRIDISLEVGTHTDSVTVNADASLLRTETGELSHNIDMDRLNGLPLFGIGSNYAGSSGIRNPLAATQLIPGALWQVTTFVAVRVNGAPANSQAIRIEGQDATNGMMQSSPQMIQPSVEAIEEFSVQTGNYDAEFGQAGGGFFNIGMRSGSNQFHGGAYDRFVNEALNASQPYLNVKPVQRRNDYGVSLGGPVMIPKVYDGHDRTFFFFNFEQFRENQIVNNIAQTVPTRAYRSGDFRQALTGRTLGKDPLGRPILEGTIYDPATERLVNGQRVWDPFPDNVIPQDRWDPVAARIQALIPLPTDNLALVNNYLPSWLSTRVTSIPAIKIDHSLSSRSKFSFYWSQTSTRSPLSVRGLGDGLPSPITAAFGTYITGSTTRLNFDQTLTPMMLLHMGAGYQGTHFNNDVEDTNFDSLEELGLKGANATFFPNFTGMTAARGGMKNMGPTSQMDGYTIKPTANASLSWVRDNHTYKFGAEMRIEGYPWVVKSRAAGAYGFSVAETALPSTLGQNLQGGTVGFPYASFLLGRVNNGDIAVVTQNRIGKSAWALFAQDTWKVTRRFTLDYGLRWDFQTYFKEQYGRVSNFSPTTPNPGTGNLPGAVIFEGSGTGRCNCDFAQNYGYAFGPRLGAAYQIESKTVLRAGLGIYYSQTAQQNQVSANFGSRNPFSSTSYGDPAILLQNGPPVPASWPNFDPGQYPTPGSLTAPPVAIDRGAGRPPRMIMWSVGVQHEIFKNLAVEASYVGNRGAWWQANSLINVNALTPERIALSGLDINSAADRALLNSALNSTIAAQRGFSTPPYGGFPMGATVAQSLRPFPQFGTVNYLWAPLGRTWFDSLQTKVTKRFSHGLEFTGIFTWQKELTMGAEAESQADIGASVNDVFNRPTNKYISGYSRPFVSVTAVSYTSPRFEYNKALSMVLSDWQIGAVLQYASGFPISTPLAQNALGSLLFRGTFANRVLGEPLFVKDLNCHCIDPNREFVLNPKAWVDPPAGQFGVSAAYFNDYRYQRRPQESMSLGRVFRFQKGISLHLRAEFSNVLNRTFMNNPDSTNAKATQTVSATGQVISGFGRINTGTVASPPRNGTIVMRIMF